MHTIYHTTGDAREGPGWPAAAISGCTGRWWPRRCVQARWSCTSRRPVSLPTSQEEWLH